AQREGCRKRLLSRIACRGCWACPWRTGRPNHPLHEARIWLRCSCRLLLLCQPPRGLLLNELWLPLADHPGEILWRFSERRAALCDGVAQAFPATVDSQLADHCGGQLECHLLIQMLDAVLGAGVDNRLIAGVDLLHDGFLDQLFRADAVWRRGVVPRELPSRTGAGVAERCVHGDFLDMAPTAKPPSCIAGPVRYKGRLCGECWGRRAAMQRATYSLSAESALPSALSAHRGGELAESVGRCPYRSAGPEPAA